METKIIQENSTGKPLAAATWLENHHFAKLDERITFAKKLAQFNPKSIVDLGCATGLWLELLNQILPTNCEFIGIDSDEESLTIASNRSKNWKRKTNYLKLDIEKQSDLIPAADITLAFNIFPYIENLESFLTILSERCPKGILAVRQYDGASIRFGPMPTEMRQTIEADLRISTETSSRFRHYDLDRTFRALKKSNFKNGEYGFELFKRITPFEQSFLPYYTNMITWTCEHISEDSSNMLKKWLKDDSITNRYFFEVDLIAVLS